MLVDGCGQSMEIVGPAGEKGEGHGKGSQEGGLSLCQGTETGDRKVFYSTEMVELFFPDTFPCLQIAAGEIVPEGVAGGKEEIEAFETLHVAELGEEQAGCICGPWPVQRAIIEQEVFGIESIGAGEFPDGFQGNIPVACSKEKGIVCVQGGGESL
jgi:hypothetical protein